jgi:hypothetical protein
MGFQSMTRINHHEQTGVFDLNHFVWCSSPSRKAGTNPIGTNTARLHWNRISGNEMKKRVLIAVMLVAASPAAAQVATSQSQQGLLPGQTELAPTQAPTQAPTTGVLCTEEMAATFCNVPTGPNFGGYGTVNRSAAIGASGTAGGLSAGGGVGGNASSVPQCPSPMPFNELCN